MIYSHAAINILQYKIGSIVHIAADRLNGYATNRGVKRFHMVCYCVGNHIRNAAAVITL